MAAAPLVVVQQLRGVDVVATMCARAAARGLAVGMRLVDARALCPQVATCDADPAADRADLHHLALWARRYCPLTAPADDGIWLDIAGAEHLFGGTRRLLADCVRRLRKSGLWPVIAAAPTCGAAWAFAHYGTVAQRFMTAPKHASNPALKVKYLTSRARLRQYLAPLPLLALRLEPGVAARMHATGLRNIGDVTGLARAPLAARFGVEFLHRLDQALGDYAETFSPISPPPPLHVCQQFAEPVAAPEDIHRMIMHLAAEIAELLQRTGLATRRLRVGWQLVDGVGFAKDIHLSRPSRDLALFHRLLAGMTQSINPEFGIENGWMQAFECSPLAPLDKGLPHVAVVKDDADGAAYAGLVDRLVARLGYGAVVRLAPCQTWQPEAAQRFELPNPEQRFDAEAAWLATPTTPTAAPRPIRLLAHPQLVEVTALLPDHPPVLFIWRQQVHKIIHATGPERIGPVWWQAPAGSRTRDYFWLRDDCGAGFWMYREGLPERGERPIWYLHGFFA